MRAGKGVRVVVTCTPSAPCVNGGQAAVVQGVASSVSGVLAHLRRRTVDLKMGAVLQAGGLIGAALGVAIFNYLKSLGQIDLFVTLCYVVFLGIVGGLMFIESVNALRKSKRGGPPKRRQRGWVHSLPLKMRFRTSGLYISVLPPVAVGLFVGMLTAIMGVGGGFIMVPAMIYLLGMPTKVVVGTSLFQIIFVSANVTILQSATNQTVDIVLALILLFGGVIGAQLGARAGAKIEGEQLRGMLALVVLAVCAKLTYDLVIQPDELFSVMEIARY